MPGVRNELSFFGFQWRQNLRNQQALRASFLLQVVGMILNNTAFFVIWIMFSQAIGVVNGWGATQSFGMLSVSMLSFGIVHTLFGSLGSLGEIVPNGRFDAYLAKPKNLYSRVLNRDLMPTVLGDLIQGLAGMVIFGWLTDMSWSDALLFILMLPPAVAAQSSFVMICDCLVFWLPQAPMIGNTLRDLIIMPTTQPISIVRGSLRLIYLTVIPALLVAGLPIELITYHTYSLIAIAYGVSAFWLAASIWLFNTSIRRYESGNVIG